MTILHPNRGATASGRPGMVRWLIVGFALLTLAAVAFIGGFQLRAEQPAAAAAATPSDGSADAGFARDMQTHHAQAVEMAMLAYRTSRNPHIQVMGYDIALTQQAQIGIMSDWLQQWRLLPTGTEPAMAWMPPMPGEQDMIAADGLMPGMATPEQMQRLRTVSGHAFDVLFCQLMIRHHLGGIVMIDGLLAAGARPDVRTLADGMKAAQQTEISTMTGILDKLGASAS
ncbi:DUF305 domain-containing protein [Hamadaea sp. NPDC050747]|uniref:DUF305 domain-containing protein n=1 Tax=Hamadaea sp. NPDC050747 TaxID=3155789 RepID=UPI0033D59C74